MKKEKPHFRLETERGHAPPLYVVGVDEVGRGPLAGPVMAAALTWRQMAPPAGLVGRLNDSKKLTIAQRENLIAEIEEASFWSVGQASVDEIDSINILQATFLAMRRAIEGLAAHNIAPHHLLIDGNRSPKDWAWKRTEVVGGDAVSLTIAAASIIAKVARDNLMKKLAEEFPHYGWCGNAGYGTPVHMKALREHGATLHHRKSFAPVREVLERRSAA